MHWNDNHSGTEVAEKYTLLGGTSRHLIYGSTSPPGTTIILAQSIFYAEYFPAPVYFDILSYLSGAKC